jgi:guanylate kinase
MPGCQTIFILPPSLPALRQRLISRQTDSPAVIERRLADAVSDMSHWDEFDYVVVNDDFGRAVGALADIVAGRGEASRSGRPELAPVLADLLRFPTP